MMCYISVVFETQCSDFRSDIVLRKTLLRFTATAEHFTHCNITSLALFAGAE